MKNLIVLRGPSGCGKTTVGNIITSYFNIPAVIPYTTREMRDNESQERPYYFISNLEMETLFFKAQNEKIILSETTFGNSKYLALSTNLPQISHLAADDNGIEKIITEHKNINLVLISLTGCHITNIERLKRDEEKFYLPKEYFDYHINNENITKKQLEREIINLFKLRILPQIFKTTKSIS